MSQVQVKARETGLAGFTVTGVRDGRISTGLSTATLAFLDRQELAPDLRVSRTAGTCAWADISTGRAGRIFRLLSDTAFPDPADREHVRVICGALAPVVPAVSSVPPDTV